MSLEFKSFKKIKQLRDLRMTITQKIHGTNAHILVFENEDGSKGLLCGSRNRFITPENDNYGFASFCYSNKDEIVEKLGLGRHDGEWCGLGVNSGEGLKERRFLLFDWWRYERSLPERIGTVPVLYDGNDISSSMINTVAETLKTSGSKVEGAEGFMRVEGVVVMIGGQRYKKVFEPESTKWTGGDKNKKTKTSRVVVDYSHLCQPIRLEKVVSKDEALTRNFPKSLGLIVKQYTKDLVDEGEIKGSKDEIKAITKGASGQIFKFVRSVMNQ